MNTLYFITAAEKTRFGKKRNSEIQIVNGLQETNSFSADYKQQFKITTVLYHNMPMSGIL